MTEMFRALLEAGYILLFLSLFAIIFGYSTMDQGTLFILLIGLSISILLIVVSIIMIRKYSR